MRKWSVTAPVVCACSSSFLVAAPDPTSATDLFEPLVPGLVATDLWIGLEGCGFGISVSILPVSSHRDLPIDATGSIYLDPEHADGDTCVVGQTRVPQDVVLSRVRTDGSTEAIGVLHPEGRTHAPT